MVVPPPPEKQAVGRFDDNFVESRRSALERMLNKTAVHPILQHDPDMKLFLESEALNVDIKHKEKQTPPIGESKGMFSSLGFTGVGKFVETDEVGIKSYVHVITGVLMGRVYSGSKTASNTSTPSKHSSNLSSKLSIW